jgi:Tfp pilus assembly protein PilW
MHDRNEAGFSMVELLVVMITAVVVVGGALAFIITSIDQENAVSSRTIAARNAEVALQQLSRDLRQAMTVDAAGNPLHVNVTSSPPTTTIAFSIPTPNSDATPQSVTWTCQGTTSLAGYCKRQVGTGGNATEIVGFRSATFTDASGNALTPPITDPNYLGIQLSLQVTSQLDSQQYAGSPSALRGSNPITVQTGIDLRNLP